MAEVTEELADAARKLLCVLGNPDLPPNYRFRVFGTVENWNQFAERLERLAAITYSKPERTDRVKRGCAVEAYLLIAMCTTQKPTNTRDGLLRTIAGLLHQFARPTADGEIVDLKSACDAVCKRAKLGINLKNERY